MSRTVFPFIVVLAATGLLSALGFAESPPVELQDGDRIVLLGDAFIERMQRNNYFETALMARASQKNITVRNLGWSGDTVQGIARALFGSPEDGYKRLLKDTREAKPTWIVLAYGGNEAHAGPAGIDNFVKQLNRLLDDLQTTGARIALVAPTPYERVSPSRPDPATYNRKLESYVQALRETASQRSAAFVQIDLPQGLKPNGLHFSDYGYWVAADALADAFCQSEAAPWRVAIDLNKKTHAATLAEISEVKQGSDATEAAWTLREAHLPKPSLPKNHPTNASATAGVVQAKGLADGQYELRSGSRLLASGSAEEFARGVAVAESPAAPQTQALNQAISLKNEYYFHRYRPQNETYLFLFRKHEQGNNAVEIPMFDPLIQAQEEEIEALRKTKPYRFSLTRRNG